jgi:hypothetical protein
MAFEDLYNDTEDIPAGGSYFIKIKTTLTHDEKERADKFMHRVQAEMDERGKMHGVVAPDFENYRKIMVAYSIVDWNLDEADGTTWALSPDSARLRNVGRLPDTVFARIYARVDELNTVDRSADRTFRDESVSGDSDGNSGTAGATEISDGDTSLGTTRNSG